jgi:hypothetical protein
MGLLMTVTSGRLRLQRRDVADDESPRAGTVSVSLPSVSATATMRMIQDLIASGVLAGGPRIARRTLVAEGIQPYPQPQ